MKIGQHQVRHCRLLNIDTGFSIQGMGNSIQGMGSSIQGMGNSIQGMGNSIQGVSNSIQGVGNSIQGMGNSIQGMGNGFSLPFWCLQTFTTKYILPFVHNASIVATIYMTVYFCKT